jgi:hypothetical protein
VPTAHVVAAVGGVVLVEDVRAPGSRHDVLAGASGEHVVAAAARERVIAGPAREEAAHVSLGGEGGAVVAVSEEDDRAGAGPLPVSASHKVGPSRIGSSAALTRDDRDRIDDADAAHIGVDPDVVPLAWRGLVDEVAVARVHAGARRNRRAGDGSQSRNAEGRSDQQLPTHVTRTPSLPQKLR